MIVHQLTAIARVVVLCITAFAASVICVQARSDDKTLDGLNAVNLYVLQLGGDDALCLNPIALLPTDSLGVVQTNELLSVLQSDTLRTLIHNELNYSTKLLRILQRQHDELEFYKNTHTARDEGYSDVVEFAKQHDKHFQRLSANVGVLQLAKQRLAQNDGAFLLAKLRSTYLFNGTSKHEGGISPDKVVVLHRPDSIHVFDHAHGVKQLLAADDTQHHVMTDSLGNIFRFLHHPDSSNHSLPGERYGNDGSYFKGYFNAQLLREGDGFSVDSTLVRCGTWKDDNYIGQIMHHHADRVYGIDISRYEHDKSRGVYIDVKSVTPEGNDTVMSVFSKTAPIDWSDLRITSLGKKAPKFDGPIDYPVDFVFIKCSEGSDLLNRYYHADLDSCLARNIPVAAYHFYSVKSAAKSQAAHFLKNARIDEGTMRPMLDVEPSEAQIRYAGGIDALLQGMTTFVQEVESATGRRCVLYLNQTFVRNYWSRFPDALRKCDIWLAKYNENHPYTKFNIWQFSDCGRVRGIIGDVDLNVFNGTRDDFVKWCSE